MKISSRDTKRNAFFYGAFFPISGGVITKTLGSPLLVSLLPIFLTGGAFATPSADNKRDRAFTKCCPLALPAALGALTATIGIQYAAGESLAKGAIALTGFCSALLTTSFLGKSSIGGAAFSTALAISLLSSADVERAPYKETFSLWMIPNGIKQCVKWTGKEDWALPITLITTLFLMRSKRECEGELDLFLASLGAVSLLGGAAASWGAKKIPFLGMVGAILGIGLTLARRGS